MIVSTIPVLLLLALLSVAASLLARGEKKRKEKIIVVFYAEDTDKNAERENYDILKQAFRTPRIEVSIG